jgi:phytoene desaturase
MKKALVIGSGFAGMSAATFLAKEGWQVTVLEKNNQPGGRGRKFEEAGFVFDMGPSWYWMPDVFERYFNAFGKKISDYYDLRRLDPSYRVYYPDTCLDIPADYTSLQQLFESLEPGSGAKLNQFLEEASYKYRVGMEKLVHKPGQRLTEFLDADLMKGLLKLDVFTSMKTHARKFFSHPYLIQLIEFPVLFLGALPGDIPALYSLMNYADIKLGTWYPMGGMHMIGKGMHQLAEEMGVKFLFDTEVSQLDVADKSIKKIKTKSKNGIVDEMQADVVIAGADYHHVENQLLQPAYRSYSENYWEKRVMAPSCLLFYVGINKRLSGITHHTLFFDTDFEKHGNEIYTHPQWPSNPLFYVCAPSVTDDQVAPEGYENLFFLIPIAAGMEDDTEEVRNRYFDLILKRYEEKTGNSIREHIIYRKSYATTDFISDYHSYKGNAYGLANTLMQTSILKPSLKSKKLKNLFYTGQLTVPGPGVPPSLISGEVVARFIHQTVKL